MTLARIKLTLLMPMAALSVGVLPGAAQVSEDEERVLAVEDAWALAVQEGNVEALTRIIGEDYVGTTATGAVQDKDAYLEVFITGDRKTYSLTTRDLLVTLYGDVAVVTHGGDATGELRGTPTGGSFRWSHVFVRRDGRWVAVTNHVTRLSAGT